MVRRNVRAGEITFDGALWGHLPANSTRGLWSHSSRLISAVSSVRSDSAPYLCWNTSARLSVSTTVWARRSTTARSPSSNANGRSQKTSTSPTMSRS
jgi:hypothetical protein